MTLIKLSPLRTERLVGTNGGKCISFGADWVRMTDPSFWTEPDSGMVCMLFRTQSVQDQYCIFDFGKFKAYGNNGLLSLDPAITNGDTTMNLQNNQPCEDGLRVRRHALAA